MAWLAVTSIALLLCGAQAHKFSTFADCPNPGGMENFDINKFLGKWNVLEVHGGSSSCISQEFNKPESEITITQRRKLPGGLWAPKYTGKLLPIENQTASHMIVKWPLSRALGESKFTVIDTDYNTYAITAECQEVRLDAGIRRSTAILARGTTLDTGKLSEITRAAKNKGVDFSDMDKINQENCDQGGSSISNLFGLLNKRK